MGRPIIDKQTSFFVSAGDASAVRREIPAFFPVPPNPNSVEQIVLQAGGCKTHSAIVCIWKQAIDAEGKPIVARNGQTIERYRVYRTVCNAGFGTTYHVRTIPPALYHETCETDPTGKTYSVCTQEVLLADDIPYTHEAMHTQVARLIDVEHQLLLFHDLPGKKGPNGETATLDIIKQAQWRKLNQSIPLGPIDRELSALTMPQKTGNCTVRSIQEYTRWELIRMGASQAEAEEILNKHWDFARGHDSKLILESLKCQEDILKNPVPIPEIISSTEMPKSQKSNRPESMNIVEDILKFFSHPEIPAFPQFKPDEATKDETNAMVKDIRDNPDSCPKPKMMRLNNLLTLELEEPKSVSKAVGLYLLEHCDAFKLASFDCMQGAIHQVASQFNNGESMGCYLTPPNLFKLDPTQGPAEQRTSGGAAMARFAHRECCDCFGELLLDPQIAQQFDELFDYRFGYLTPKIDKEKECVEFLKQHVDKLLLNVERVAIDGKPSQSVIQVLNSGIAIGQYDLPGRNGDASVFLSQMTDILLGAQYQAVAKVAILEAQQNPNKRIPVIFTMVGGGVFGNDKKMIAKAISQAIAHIRNSGVNNLDICLSIFSANENKIYQDIVAQEGQEYADLKELLSKPSLTQDKLENLRALPQPKQENRILPLILLGVLTAALVAATIIMGLLTFGVGFSAIPFVPGIIGLVALGIAAIASAMATVSHALNYHHDSNQDIPNNNPSPVITSYASFSQYLPSSPTKNSLPIEKSPSSPIISPTKTTILPEESSQFRP